MGFPPCSLPALRHSIPSLPDSPALFWWTILSLRRFWSCSFSLFFDNSGRSSAITEIGCSAPPLSGHFILCLSVLFLLAFLHDTS